MHVCVGVHACGVWGVYAHVCGRAFVCLLANVRQYASMRVILCVRYFGMHTAAPTYRHRENGVCFKKKVLGLGWQQFTRKLQTTKYSTAEALLLATALF